MKCIRSVIFAIVCAACACAQQRDFEITQNLRLNKQANGIDGALKVLTDSRLSGKLRDEMWGGGDWSFVLAQGDKLSADLEANPPRKGEIRIVGDSDRVLQSASLEQPLARITETHVRKGRTSFFVAIDYSVGFGSYSGITTFLLDVVDGQFQWAEATKIDTHQTEQIRLPHTLKSAWKVAPFHGNQDILWVYCRPAMVQAPGRDFVVGYVRYRFDGKRWLKYERVRNGFWESDQSFPSLSSFP